MVAQPVKPSTSISTHAPAGGATRLLPRSDEHRGNFYSRPCGRGDLTIRFDKTFLPKFLLTPLREGRPAKTALQSPRCAIFLLTPLREGRLGYACCGTTAFPNFYSRPCGRGDGRSSGSAGHRTTDFYSRPCGRGDYFRLTDDQAKKLISTHAPAGGATMQTALITLFFPEFLLTPLREGRHAVFQQAGRECAYFYSRPCGRGDK